MRRLPITLVLTALTGLALGTAAIAAPDGIGIGDCPMADDLAMAAMHADADARLAMHDHMMTMHPEMADHLEESGLDPDRMRDWMAEGLDHDEMHQRMQQAGVDLEAMHEACPMSDGVMPHDGAMPHGDHAHHGGAGHGHESGAHDDTLHDRHHR